MVCKHGNKTGTILGTILSSMSDVRRAKHLKAPCTAVATIKLTPSQGLPETL